MYSLDFRQIPEFPRYAASRGGLIVRIATVGGRIILRSLRPAPDECGYLRVRPSENGLPVKRTVHGLMATTFIGPKPAGMEVDHIDCNNQNNSASSLEYVTPEENRRRYLESAQYQASQLWQRENGWYTSKMANL